MENQVIQARVKNLYKTEAEWLINNPIIFAGEIAIVQVGRSHKFKIGDGIKTFSLLDYVVFETGNLKGALTPVSSAFAATEPISFIAEAGVYPNYGGVEITGAAGYIVWDGEDWKAVNIEVGLTPNIIKDMVVNASVTLGTEFDNKINEQTLSIGYVSGAGYLDNGDTEWRKVRTKTILGNTQYTISCQGIGFSATNNKNICFFDNSGNFISRMFFNEPILPFLTPVDTAYAYINVAYVHDGDNMNDYLSAKLMLNHGPVVKPYVAFSENPPKLLSFFGYDLPGSNIEIIEMSYSSLKSKIEEGTLVPNRKIIVTNAPVNKTIIVTALTNNSICKQVEVLGENFDFFELDSAADKIYAFDIISGVIRVTSGVWHFIIDAEHTPKGLVSINQTSNSVIINYAKSYTKVLALNCSPDETYALKGVAMGASVGLALSIIQFSSYGLTGEIKEVSGELTIINNGFQNPIKNLSFNSTNGELTITHVEVEHAGVACISKNVNHRIILVSASNTSTIVKIIDQTNTVVLNRNDIDFSFSRSGVRKLLSSEMEVEGANIWINGTMMKEFS